MKRKIFLWALLVLVATFSLTPAIAQACSCEPVRITKELYCRGDKPPYYVGEKYYWWIRIRVAALTELSDVVVFDRFGAELMIEGISVGDPTPIDYNFTYMPYEWGGIVYINGTPQGNLDDEGVSFDGFHIYWTGKSVKAHFQWNIGSMSNGQRETIYVIVSTDTNPKGWQEYTSCGCYCLNSGATVKAIDACSGKKFSASSESMEICVSCPPCETQND